MADPLSSISGLSSGIDFKALVDQTIALERRPAARLEAQKAADARRKTALEDVRAALTALRTAADGLRTGAAFDAFLASASGADASGRALVTAAATAGAAEGTYEVVVERLAAGQKTVGTAGVPDGPMGVDGTFTVNGREVAVAAGDTLAQVRDKINALAAQTGVRASLIVGGPSDHRLVLTSTGVGAASAFTVADASGSVAGATLGLTGPPDRPAQDARLVVDGVPAERPSNTVNDVLPGVTLTLGAADPARPAAVTIARAPNVAADAARGLVDAFNKARALVVQQRAAGSALAGDPLLRTLTASLSAAVLAPDAALPDGLTTLAGAGVSLQRDGTLAFDRARFDRAAAAAPDGVRAAFASRLDGVDDLLGGITAPYSGLLDQRASAISGRAARIDARVLDIDARLDKRRTTLLAQYAKLEASLGRLKAIGDSLTTQFAGLNKKSSS